jgi:hypothetical protein
VEPSHHEHSPTPPEDLLDGITLVGV